MKPKPTRPKGMGVAEFIQTYFTPKMLPVHRQIIQLMSEGRKLVIYRPNGKDVIAERRGFRVFVRPYKPKRQKLIVTLDEAGELSNDFYADWIKAKRKELDKRSPAWEAYKNGDWGVDLAQGKDKNAIVNKPPEQEKA